MVRKKLVMFSAAGVTCLSLLCCCGGKLTDSFGGLLGRNEDETEESNDTESETDEVSATVEDMTEATTEQVTESSTEESETTEEAVNDAEIVRYIKDDMTLNQAGLIQYLGLEADLEIDSRFVGANITLDGDEDNWKIENSGNSDLLFYGIGIGSTYDDMMEILDLISVYDAEDYNYGLHYMNIQVVTWDCPSIDWYLYIEFEDDSISMMSVGNEDLSMEQDGAYYHDVLRKVLEDGTSAQDSWRYQYAKKFQLMQYYEFIPGGYLLIDIDQDGIPEMVTSIQLIDYDDVILEATNHGYEYDTWRWNSEDLEVQNVCETTWSTCFIEGANIVMCSTQAEGKIRDEVYELQNGEMTYLAGGYQHSTNPEEPAFVWNDLEVSQSEYKEILDQYYDLGQCKYMTSDACEWDEMKQMLLEWETE